MEKYTVVISDAISRRLIATEVVADSVADAKRIVFKEPKDRVIAVFNSKDFNPDNLGVGYKHYVQRLWETDKNLDTYMWFNTHKAAIKYYALAMKVNLTGCQVIADSETMHSFFLQKAQRPQEQAEYCVRVFDIENRLMHEEEADTEEKCLERAKVFVDRYIRYPVKAYKRSTDEPNAWNVLFSTSGVIY